MFPFSASSCQGFSEINEQIEETPKTDDVIEDDTDFVPIVDGYDADHEEDGDNDETFYDEDENENPLANLLPQEYKDIDPRKLFPDFRKGKVETFCCLL